MNRWVVPVLALVLGGACTFRDGQQPAKTADAAGVDATDARMIDVLQPMFCFGRTEEDKVCLSEMPSGSVPLPGSIDTDGELCSSKVASGPAGCVIAGDSITAGSFVSAFGSRPLILIATDTITISQLLDVSSHRGGVVGAGHDMTGCDAAGATAGLGGGAGGSFAGHGGDGGAQNGGNAGATAGDPIPAATIRGGCPGSMGGSGGPGGHGGGAVLLIANSVVITSQINASGESGGAAGGGGGGGGGSGGMIAIDADSVSGGGALLANGGGGAGGTNPTAPGNGDEPDPSFPGTPADGGIGADGSDGGAGGAGMTHDGSPGDQPTVGGTGGGGGGGSVGVIRFYGATLDDGTISPS